MSSLGRHPMPNRRLNGMKVLHLALDLITPVLLGLKLLDMAFNRRNTST